LNPFCLFEIFEVSLHFIFFQILPHLGKSALARYIMMSLLNLTSVLILTDLDSPTFVANTMEVAMRMLETGILAQSVFNFCQPRPKCLYFIFPWDSITGLQKMKNGRLPLMNQINSLSYDSPLFNLS